MDNKLIIAIIAIVLVLIVGGGYYYTSTTSVDSDKTDTIIIYAADSLANQINTTTQKFNEKYPNVKVETHFGGSQKMIKEITELNKTADIMASADYGLIDKRLMPNKTTFNLKYASNSMVLAYTDKSAHANEINQENWYTTLLMDDVKLGFGDPNSDPCGYRSVMVLELASILENKPEIFEIITNNSAITLDAKENNYTIKSPTDLNPSEKLLIRPDAAAAMPALQSGEADYVLTYKNIAEQQKDSGIKYLELPGELALNDTQYEKDYSQITLVENVNSDKSKDITLSPIVYGITVIKDGPSHDLAAEYVALLLSPDGNKIIEDSYQVPISPAVPTENSTDIPEVLQQYIQK